MKQILAILAACSAVLLLSAAVFLLGFGALSMSQSARSVLLGSLIVAVVPLLVGLILYGVALRSLRNRGVLLLHAALGVSIVGCAVLLSKWHFSGYFRPGLALRDGVLEINGPLDREILRAFQALLETENLSNVRVRLHSPGGDSLAGMAIGREIHRLRLDVEVDQLCASSCANYLFTAGENKYLESVNDVRFHGGALQPNFVQAALDVLQAGTQMETFDPDELPDSMDEGQLRELYGLRDDLPFNPAASILVEKAFFDEIGISQLTPVFGQFGDYASWFDDGVHDSYFYSPEDYALLGVANVHVVESDANVGPDNDEQPFRAKVRIESIEMLEQEMDALRGRIEASMPFSADQIWSKGE